ncbi:MULTISPECIES: antibiotic biosynthesis monooxygenase family protein [Streptomyces]|uniref:Antibiotic biosynthesis monooxygenase n=1 Tax=Streptomyces dengpaensis TaxID=2049881 RepID=A0ABN5HV26_9ACTN|nr:MULTISPECIES: antibiotic biosynthesis monooxygenase family protein [Streptomyces]AVH54794.1 antibiotic biosynthesis monooxygenase [Streptomyces dengpaensis]PIB04023.1 antibiotic biosynthesis monooxygenase [Streptomyces sp. HG99]
MAVWEVVQLTVAQGSEEDFESVFRAQLPILEEADGCLDLQLLRAVDREGVFLLLVLWQSMEHHTVVFVKTEGFTKFSTAVAPFFTAPPTPFHAITVIDGL